MYGDVRATMSWAATTDHLDMHYEVYLLALDIIREGHAYALVMRGYALGYERTALGYGWNGVQAGMGSGLLGTCTLAYHFSLISHE